jgi:hypothetical protein
VRIQCNDLPRLAVVGKDRDLHFTNANGILQSSYSSDSSPHIQLTSRAHRRMHSKKTICTIAFCYTIKINIKGDYVLVLVAKA